MASYIPPVVHATGDAFAVTDNNALAGDAVFLYQRPYAAYFNSVSTSIPNTTFTQVTLGGTTTSGYGFSVSSNNIVVPLTGTYWVAGAVCMGLTAASNPLHLAYVYHNGTQTLQGTLSPLSNAFDSTSVATGLISCSAGDTLGLWEFQASSGTLSTVAGGLTYLHVVFQGSQ